MPKDGMDVATEDAGISGSELASLKQQRTNMKRNITNIQKKVEKDGDKVDATILECRLQILESYLKQMCYIQGQIEKLCPTDTARSDLEEIFISAKAKVMVFLNKNRGSVSMDHSLFNGSIADGSNSTRLPSLKLPRFDGKYADYKRFVTTFNNMVHENCSITNIEKFNYLLNCLSGPALAVVEPYQVTENYPMALKRLEERYDNKVLIFLEHINALFDIATMCKGDSVSLRNIIDTVSATRGSLKLDPDTRENYDEKQEFKSLPSWDTCYDVLNHRCQLLESHGKKVEGLEKTKGAKQKPNLNRSSHTFVNSTPSCSYCNSSEHNISSCSSFTTLVVLERFNFVKRNGHCINCLRKGHLVSKCLSKSRCRICQSSHHSLIHKFNAPEPAGPSISHQGQPQTQLSENYSNPVSLVARWFKRAIIPTAVVLIKASCGTFHPVRALLDSCSEINFISEETAKRLQLKFQPYNEEVSGIGEVRTKIKSSVDVTVKSRVSLFHWSSKLVVTKSIAVQQPGEYIQTSHWMIPQTIELADPLFYQPQRIDLLISTEVFFDLLLDGRVTLGDGIPCLTNTVFGWIVGGTFQSASKSSLPTCNLACSSPSCTLDSILKQFWEIEEYSKSPLEYSKVEEECERHFAENVSIDQNNRVQVSLPFKNPKFI